MSEYNIQMNKYNALNAEYDQLYPATKIKNVNGLDTALQNNDPRNWGLGKLIGKYVADLNTHLENGWYYTDASTLNCPVNAGAIVEVSNRDNTIEVQTFWYWMGSGILIKVERLFNGTEWQPWEYVNPPMLLGVEYRTTERWLGHPVYVKTINFGAMADGKSVEVVKNPNHVVRCSAVIGEGNGTLPAIYPQAIQQSVCFTANVTQNADGERIAAVISRIGTSLGDNVTATVTVWYTKLTD